MAEASASIKKNRTHDSILERIFVSLVTFAITVTLCIQWYKHRNHLLERFVHEEEYRVYVKEKMNLVWQVLLICSSLFLLKGYYRAADRRKGSARLDFNKSCNVSLALFTGFLLMVASEAIQVKGYIGVNGVEVGINGRFVVIDTHLRGIGGVICKEENSGEIVDIPSTTAVQAEDL
ncbi:hypothetical protein COLO4_19213 [Corchorus olitorius]|uniref:Uncharacterized protein n=1 Tax=Corchorus olitorius TaxID=93759 RepID=A0A1R3J6E4_9ROSI|nr:hypothetical protein COLO4_19213 [Corchorus olitorius]